MMLWNCISFPSNHRHIWQMSPQLSVGDICQIWPWYSIPDQCFDNIEKWESRNPGNWFSNLHPCWWWRHGMRMLSLLLAISYENPQEASGIPLHKGPVISTFDCFLLSSWISCWTFSRCNLRRHNTHLKSLLCDQKNCLFAVIIMVMEILEFSGRHEVSRDFVVCFQ